MNPRWEQAESDGFHTLKVLAIIEVTAAHFVQQDLPVVWVPTVGGGVKLCDLWRFETVGGNLVVGSPAPA